MKENDNASLLVIHRIDCDYEWTWNRYENNSFILDIMDADSEWISVDIMEE